MILSGTTDILELVTGQAGTIDVVADLVDFTAGAGAPLDSQVTAISTATTTTIVSAPGASHRTRVKSLSVRNKDASAVIDVTVQLDRSGTNYERHKETLQPGWCLEYIEGIGFFVMRPLLNDSRLLTQAESSDTQRVFRSTLSAHGNIHTFLTITGTAYYVYVGRMVQDVTPKFVEFQITTVGAGTDTKEVGLFSSPSPPNKSAQTLTKIVATGTVDSGTSLGMKRNTSAFATVVPKGTHLWAAFRGALGTTQITAGGLAGDMAQGAVLFTTGLGALTGLTTAAAAVPTIGTTTNSPDLSVTLD